MPAGTGLSRASAGQARRLAVATHASHRPGARGTARAGAGRGQPAGGRLRHAPGGSRRPGPVPRTAAHPSGHRPGRDGPPSPQPPAPGPGLPGSPAGPGTVVDAGLAAAPARALRARLGPGTLTRSPASDTQTQPPSPRGPPRNLRTRIPPPKARAAGERHANLPSIPHTRSHTYACQEGGATTTSL